MPDQLDVTLVKILDQLDLTEQMVREHVIRPDYIGAAALRVELHDAGDGNADPVEPPAPSGLLYRLNANQLNQDLHNLLSVCVAGYSMKLRQYGRTIFSRQWNWARTPSDGNISWSSSAPMHVASVSKLVTAMAMTKLLHSRNISADANILPWLPKYWQKGPGVERITFRQLLTHTSGLVLKDEPGPSDFQFMKDQIALGTVGAAGYRNINYGLCRILISTIDASYLFNMVVGATDAYWDLTTIRYYAKYVSDNVFAPAGVTSTLLHTDDNALAYPYPVNAPGWNSGDLSTMSGCVAWHLSVDDLLRIMATFRRGGTIVDPVRAQTMLDRQFGIDVKRDTSLGRIYAKGGFWGFDSGRFIEQTNAIFLPKGMELAILANSPFCSPNMGFMNQVLDTIQKNIEFRWLAVTVAAASIAAASGLLRNARVTNYRR